MSQLKIESSSISTTNNSDLLVVLNIHNQEMVKVRKSVKYFILNSQKEIQRSLVGEELAKTRFCPTYTFLSHDQVLLAPHMHRKYIKAMCPKVLKAAGISN